MDVRAWLERCPIVAILRGVQPAEVESIGFALQRAGISIVEVPLNSPNPLQSIAILSRCFGANMLVGAGTLTDPAQVADVVAAGGKLIVTPHADLAIVRATKQAGLIAMPGFFNPTEAFALLQAGADALKLFPAEVLGPAMLKAMLAVLPKATIVIPVGGVDAQQVASWLAAGALGLGAGSSIYKPGDDARIVEGKAQALLAAVNANEGVGCAMKRRAFLRSLAATAVASGLRGYAVALPKMKITRVRAYLPPNPNPLFNQSDVVVTIETDAGITGIGEGGMKDNVSAFCRQVDRPRPAIH